MHLSLTLLHAVSRSLAQHGVAMEALTAAGLGDALPPSTAGSMPWAEATGRIERALGLSRDPALALRIGDETSARALQVVGLAVLNARTVRDAATTFTRFAPLVIAGARFELVEDGELAKFVFEPPPAPPGVARATVEFTLALVSRIAKDLLQRDKRTWFVRVRHEDLGYRDVYESVFGCEPEFGSSENALGFARDTLDLVLTGGDDALRGVLSQRAEQALAVQEQGTKLSVRVRALLREADLDKLEIRALAKELALSSTALRRRLSIEGTTWSDLVDEARRERALEALAHPDTTIKELSDRLGFSEPRAFHRAFRRWTGTTPNEYRSRATRKGAVA